MNIENDVQDNGAFKNCTEGDNADGSSGEPLSPSPYQDDMRDYAPDNEILVPDNWRERVVMTSGKFPKIDRISLYNAILYIENLFPNLFILNEFSDEIFIVKCPPWCDPAKFYPRPYQQFDIVHLSAALEKFGLSSDLKRTVSSIQVIAKKNSIHPVRSRFDKMKWDGVDRLSHWLYDITKSSQNRDYLSRIGTSWLVAGVARIYRPGTKFDHMLLFEGIGGKGKSTAFKELATFGDQKKIAYFSDGIALDEVSKPSSIAKMQGKLIIEFADLDGMNKSDDNTLKKFLTQTQDEVQKKFENPVTVYPRQCLFAGTTNEDEYLRDTTGNRRYWPVKIKEINIEKLIEIKEHLWAQAIHLYKNGYEFFITDKDPVYNIFLDEQAQRLTSDPWEHIIREECLGKKTVYADKILGIVVSDVSKRDQRSQRRVTGILRKIGYESITKRNGDKIERCWEIKGIKDHQPDLSDIPDIPFQ